jgi:hypothetical protein
VTAEQSQALGAGCALVLQCCLARGATGPQHSRHRRPLSSHPAWQSESLLAACPSCPDAQPAASTARLLRTHRPPACGSDRGRRAACRAPAPCTLHPSCSSCPRFRRDGYRSTQKPRRPRHGVRQTPRGEDHPGVATQLSAAPPGTGGSPGRPCFDAARPSRHPLASAGGLRARRPIATSALPQPARRPRVYCLRVALVELRPQEWYADAEGAGHRRDA